MPSRCRETWRASLSVVRSLRRPRWHQLSSIMTHYMRWNDQLSHPMLIDCFQAYMTPCLPGQATFGLISRSLTSALDKTLMMILNVKFGTCNTYWERSDSDSNVVLLPLRSQEFTNAYTPVVSKMCINQKLVMTTQCCLEYYYCLCHMHITVQRSICVQQE